MGTKETRRSVSHIFRRIDTPSSRREHGAFTVNAPQDTYFSTNDPMFCEPAGPSDPDGGCYEGGGR